MNRSESIKELATALSQAQASISNPKKNAANPFFKSKYSDLSEVINVSKPVLSEHGLSILQMPMYENNMVSVETMLIHVSGEYISSVISMPIIKPDPQSIGSLISYCRRYAWAAVCGLAQEDDDTNSATQRQSQAMRQSKKSITPQDINLWNNAKAAYIRDGNLDSVMARVDISKENQKILISEVEQQGVAA